MTNEVKTDSTLAASSKSRQQRWQDARRADGLCTRCGQQPLATDPPSASLCAACREKDRARAKAYYWRSGRRGLKRYHANKKSKG